MRRCIHQFRTIEKGGMSSPTGKRVEAHCVKCGLSRVWHFKKHSKETMK
jgi:hypothetical protein